MGHINEFEELLDSYSDYEYDKEEPQDWGDWDDCDWDEWFMHHDYDPIAKVENANHIYEERGFIKGYDYD